MGEYLNKIEFYLQLNKSKLKYKLHEQENDDGNQLVFHTQKWIDDFIQFRTIMKKKNNCCRVDDDHRDDKKKLTYDDDDDTSQFISERDIMTSTLFFFIRSKPSLCCT